MSRELPPVLQVAEHSRRLSFSRFQRVGLPLLFVVPLLALLGLFGETWDRTEGASDGLALLVEYPTRYRYKQLNTVEVFVENTSAATLDTVVVAFDPAYVRRFSTLSFIPSPKEPFEVELFYVKPGETRLVWAELQGEHYGRHEGTIEAYRPGSPDTARVAVSTLILP